MTALQFKTFRRKRKASIIELAAIVGISQERIAAWEMGLEQLPVETMEMLADAIQNFECLRKKRFLKSLEPWIPGDERSKIQ